MNNPGDNLSLKAALGVMQQAVLELLKWSNFSLNSEFKTDLKNEAINNAKKLFSWTETSEIKPLRLLFDAVKLDHEQDNMYYAQPQVIKNQDPIIPYPVNQEPTKDELQTLKNQINQEIQDLNLTQSDWNNLSLLTLIVEKYGSFISFVYSDVALIDLARSTAAVAAALVEDYEAQNLYLIAGDLSGIQNFIYTISSDGALKSLRARSFYLELVTEEIVQQLLIKLDLPKTSVIYAGGGNLYILSSGDEEKAKKAVQEIGDRLNKWLRKNFQGKVFLALDYVELPTANVSQKSLSEAWEKVPQKLGKLKHRKFETEISDFLAIKPSYEPCRVCHRDDTENLEPLSDPDSVLACPTCRKMFALGEELLKVNLIIRSPEKELTGSHHPPIDFDWEETPIYYHVFRQWKQITTQQSDTVLLVNDWDLEHYRFRCFKNPSPLFLGQYAQKSYEEQNQTIRANELADIAEGIKRVGYLRMDVDKLGQIFAKGLGEHQNLPRLAGLSRQMTYFFKVYLNSLAENREDNLFKPLGNSVKSLSQSDRKNLVFIYAGGDDLFISGAWNEVVEFSFDVYQSFRHYTGQHPDITISGGISLAGAKFPLYQAASGSGSAEEKAKGNGRDSLGLFNTALKWEEWLGKENIKVSQLQTIDATIKKYLQTVSLPDLFGVLPFVQKLQTLELEVNTSRNFVRNLLTTAQLQEQKIKEFQEKTKAKGDEDSLNDIRYYLHLPKIAYTLARLPDKVRNNEGFRPVMTSLKNPYNAPYFRAIATWIEYLNR
ncbi:type III-A CRISPR-associated protein Cas10/Csm1 [Planktothrix paucivesiculata]|uniref:CRISPR system single-strand-specific deoxyribonuclease Cas10/Csm1 (subtype III-A) n=1 Tax=Planktothrix paucivesiculata PCC 9631 TaxID=671071 RepID=A0A7Z9BPX8_9CYAN|nr:type III-A CRISPR-associated protein Cas10/Csm1 [Planktothrix paucivesiculata]VXD14452.1 CRISPR-associated protein, Csm1 family [Planktothrix paucivesiculata PCC 9631]